VIPVLGRAPALLLAAAAIHVHHRHGASLDYWGIGLAALASWVGLPGPGEATLITAGILASHHRLDLGLAIIAALAGATLGGTIGWAVGRHAGSAVLTGPGPFRRARVWALARGERFYSRFGVVAVFLTPSWVAGILRVRSSFYLPANAASAVVWALAWGLGAYLVGPSVTDIATDVGYAGLAFVVVLVGGVVVAAFVRRRRDDGGRVGG
jgi:membrane protein DedA with SNARE-associated domain